MQTSKIWEEQLKTAFPVDFERIEPKEDEDLTDDPTVIEDWKTRIRQLVRELTLQFAFGSPMEAERLESFQELPMSN